MPTYLTIPRFQINGVLDTSNSVLSNLNMIANSAGCWISFDSTSGLWSVVINKPGTSVKSFDDSNILGGINISGSGINELFNGVTISFPNKDLRDQTDVIEFEIDTADRFPNELDNVLGIDLPLLNDPAQAAFVGQVELKQSRVDKVIEFRTDYTSLGLKGGDLIDITSVIYGYTNKIFRILKIIESDSDDGSIVLSITALEYDEDVYSETGLQRIERNKKTGIVPKSMNGALSEDDWQSAIHNLKVNPVIFVFNARGNDALDWPGRAINGAAAWSGFFYIRETTRAQIRQSLPLELGGSGVDYLSFKDARNLYFLDRPFTVPVSGTYKITYKINWGGEAVAFPSLPSRPIIIPPTSENNWITTPQQVYKTSGVQLEINGFIIATAVNNATQFTGTGEGYDILTSDHNVDLVFEANKGDTLNFWLYAVTDWGPNHPEAVAGYPNAAVASVIGELSYLHPEYSKLYVEFNTTV